ncbi:hypothetical protein [Clostridium perfringens]|uniref:hypothetical protein n=1 Tax=Clostridium perfringens TaxID=1502 RepID=UPI001F578339|nr:hypothetical protein [Clostridium perfringens]UNM61140.1 hypothetical protein MN196_03575 [Clostridium perfringens]
MKIKYNKKENILLEKYYNIGYIIYKTVYLKLNVLIYQMFVPNWIEQKEKRV